MDLHPEPLKIIDVDTHLTEPHDLWVSRAPSKWKDRVPQVKLHEGRPMWLLDGTEVLSSTRASSIVLKDKSKGVGYEAAAFLDYSEVHPASYSVNERLQLMDEMGFWAQIMYPNLMGFGGAKLPTTDPALKTMCVRIYNDAMAEFQEQSGQRLFGMALLPWWNIKEAVEEARRAHGMGLRGVNTNPNPQEQGFPDLGDDYWSPLYEACSDLGLPINFHVGASEEQWSWVGAAPWKSHNKDQALCVGSSTLYMQNASVIANLIVGGVPERFPKIKFVSVESGLGWIPFLLEALDYSAEEIMVGVADKLSLRTSEYFRRNFSACFWFEERSLPESIRLIGEDNVMFESDFPHSTCLYPGAVDRVMNALSSVSPEVRAKAVSGNAARLYSIPLPA